MLGNYWIPSRESLVTVIERSSIEESLNKGYNVIVDATNLNPKFNKWFYSLIEFNKNYHKVDGYKLELEFKEFKIPLNKAIRRDWWRGVKGGRTVGKKVVKQFYNKYYKK